MPRAHHLGLQGGFEMSINVDENKVVVNLTNEELDIVYKALNYLKANIEEFNDMQIDWMFPTVSAEDIENLLKNKI